MTDERQMTTHKRHRCRRRHRSYRTLARCIWRRAEWVEGEGQYVLISGLGHGRRARLGITLQASVAQAEEELRRQQQFARGPWRYRIERLVDPGEAEGGTPRREGL